MKDNHFSGIIRSGTSHSVSVSERTGNAKTPKNIVTSDAEETASRVKAFEEKHGTALQPEKLEVSKVAPSVNVVAGLESASTDDAGVALTQTSDAPNIQTVAKQAGSENIQSIAADAASADHRQPVAVGARVDPNLQSVATDVIADNRQKVGGDQPAAVNVQHVNTDVLSDNLQNVGERHIAANVQSVPSGEAMASNVQVIPTDVIATNKQDVSAEQVAANRQDVFVDSPISDNLQAVPTEVMSDNVQTLASAHTPANVQAVGAENSAEPNVQSVGVDSVSANSQTLTSDTQPANRQAIEGVAGTSANRLAIPQETTPDNTQTLDLDATTRGQATDVQSSHDQNHQRVEVAASVDNHQSLEMDAAQPNRQTLASDETPAPAAQGLEKQHIQDHLEALPSTQVTRATADVGVQPTSSSLSTPAQVTKASAPQPAAKAPPLTQAEQMAQKARHDKFTAAFQGRLAGIKNKVNDIHHKLDTFDKK